MENEDELIKKNKNKIKIKKIKRGNPPFFIFKMDIHGNKRI
jgi:hypothetical protein